MIGNQLIEIDSEMARIRAALVNTGRYTLPEADQKLIASKLSVILTDEAVDTLAGQAAFLTAIVTGIRCFGEVSVYGNLSRPSRLSVPCGYHSLAAAAMAFGAQISPTTLPVRSIFVGPMTQSANTWAVQAYWDGWTSGVGPGSETIPTGRSDCALAGVAAGALAVGQAFLAEQGDPRAGKTNQNVSLWSPKFDENSLISPGPEKFLLPLDFWMIGLGNLGQAYLWSLSMLQYPHPDQVHLILQDDDRVQKENWGTSVLVNRGDYGALKTKRTEEWAHVRGFDVRRIDRRLDKTLRRTENEPAIALAGLDNMPARRLLEYPGFEYIIDSGLGSTASDYQKFRINVFDSNHNPANHFDGVEDPTTRTVEQLMQLPVYQGLARIHGTCGAATLAEHSVAVPFVSAFVGAVAITQAIRIASGHAHDSSLTGDIGDLRNSINTWPPV